ncbi:hypothetical protein IV203_037533 [Nitzschia inconspicua]|uniref:Uncharacterized protein n=1 Tax=Nitzschia inconspicua TaxID=303405 RepID=A0A9K3PYN0_9STRA|nr:hypothetical protein IV203_037533 [Nitzschia inconspicua]
MLSLFCLNSEVSSEISQTRFGPVPIETLSSTVQKELRDSESAAMSVDSRLSDTVNSEASGCSRRVSFSTIEIHEHHMIMGISPSTSDGCPLEIDWEVANRISLDLDQYEELRPPRRVKNELAMPSSLRELLLLESGYTKRQINEQVRLVQLGRRRSALGQDMILNMVAFPRRLMRKKQLPGKSIGGKNVV